MRLKDTCAPRRKRLASPPPDSRIVVPTTGAPCSDSFQATSCDSERMAASEIGAAPCVPSSAIPVESRL